MSSIQYTLSDTLRIDCRGFSGNEKQTDEESGFFRSENVINLIGSRHHGFKDMAFAFCKTSFPPFIAVVGGFQNRLLIVPVSEYIACDIVGIDVFRILQPLMMQNLGGHGSFTRPIGSGNHNQNRAMITCCHSLFCLWHRPIFLVPHA